MQCTLMPMLEAGDTLDHYRLDSAVARGGMATLFRRRISTTQDCCHQGAARRDGSRPGAVERFRREQQIGQELDHPGIVKTYDGKSAAGSTCD